MSDIYSILTSLGYQLHDFGQFWRCKPLYRDSGSLSVSISKKNGAVTDFAHPENSGSFKKLLALTLGKDLKEVEKFLNIKQYKDISSNSYIPQNLDYTYPSIYSNELLCKLHPNHDYWLNRGISLDTLKQFQGGIVEEKTKFQGRYTFPIFARDGEIINGFAGRATWEINDHTAKWKICGRRSLFEYPLHLTQEHIRQKKEVLIVESIGDGLKLYDANIKNFIVVFGINAFRKITLLLVELDPEKIIIGLNNDQNKAGNKAAFALEKLLANFFHKDGIKNKPPQYTNDICDIGDINKVKEYYEWARK